MADSKNKRGVAAGQTAADSHIDARANDLMSREGITREEASRRARIEFGSIEKHREECRGSLGWRRIDAVRGDFLYGVRQLRKHPTFTVTAVLTIALGIAVNASMFSIVNGFLRPLPVKNPEQLTVLATEQRPGLRLSYPDFLDYRAGADVFSDMTAWDTFRVALTANEATNRSWVALISGNYFSLLGIQPALGRLITPTDGEMGGTDPIIVLGYDYWARQFAKDQSIIGKPIKVNGRAFTIAGVAPEGFRGTFEGFDFDAYLPMELFRAKSQITNRDIMRYRVIGRLKAGTTLEQARTSVDTVSHRLQQEYPSTNAKRFVRVYPERLARPEPTMADRLPFVAATFLLLAVAVLLIACANVLGLFLARGLARGREMAIRTSLGASRSQLVRICLVEAFLISAFGTILGATAGAWTARLLENISAPEFTMKMDFSMDWRVFAYLTILMTAATLLTGLLPAMRSAHSDPHESLRETQVTISGSRRHRARTLLAVSQIASSVVLLVIAGLFIRTLGNLESMDVGFARDHLLLVSVDPGGIGYDKTRAASFFKETAARLASLPGADSVAQAATVPFGASADRVAVTAESQEPPRMERDLTAFLNFVSTDYFQTMKIPVVAGRVFADSDEAVSAPKVVVNDLMASKLWPGQDAVGKRFRSIAGPEFIEVIGVVKASRQLGTDPPPAQYFLPIDRSFYSDRTFYIRTKVQPESLGALAQSTIRGLDPEIPIYEIKTMDQQISLSPNGFGGNRAAVFLAAVFGLLAVALALVGTYGVLSFMVSQRITEVGIRMALGADRPAILKMFLRHGLTLVIAGIFTGLFLAAGIGRLLESRLFGVSAFDPVTLISVTVLLFIAALATCLIPSFKATRTDPLTALKYE